MKMPSNYTIFFFSVNIIQNNILVAFWGNPTATLGMVQHPATRLN